MRPLSASPFEQMSIPVASLFGQAQAAPMAISKKKIPGTLFDLTRIESFKQNWVCKFELDPLLSVNFLELGHDNFVLLFLPYVLLLF